MIRRLIILLLIVGCEEAGITSNGLTDGTAVTDTLYIFNYDTLIFTNYDTTIVNNYDTLIITNYDTTIVYDTLIVTNNDTLVVMDTVFIEIDNDKIFDVDWILVKIDSIEYYNETGCGGTEYGTGYYIITNSSSGIQLEDNHLQNNSGVLSFTYNNETFSYDLSDSFIQELAGCGNYYWFDAMDKYERIIYNTQSEYLISINGIEGDDVIIINLKQPNEIIDYR